VCIDWTCQSLAIPEGYEHCPCACKFYQKTAEAYIADCSCSNNNNCMSFDCEPHWEPDYDYELRSRIGTNFSETRAVKSREETSAEWPSSGEGPSIGDRTGTPADSSETTDAGQPTEEPSYTSEETATVRPRAKRFSHEDATTKKVAVDDVSKMDIGPSERSARLTEDLLLMAECSCDCLLSANLEELVYCECPDSRCAPWDCRRLEEKELEGGRGGGRGEV